MRRIGIALGTLVIVVLLSGFGSAGARVSNAVTVKIPLPAPNTVRIASFTVNTTAPVQVTAANAAQLGSAQTNTQAMAVTWRSGATTTLALVIHRFPPARGMTSARSAAADEITMIVEAKTVQIHVFTQSLSRNCGWASHIGLTTDAFLKSAGLSMTQLAKGMDSPVEEQIDGAMAAVCPGSEGDDPGGS